MPGRTRVGVLAILALLAAGFTAPLATSAFPMPRAAWTVMVYMSGDNSLERYIVNDLERELAASGSTRQVQVVALADRGPGRDERRGDWRSTKLFHVTRGMRANAASAVADWGERNMGDPQTLRDFVAWSKAHYPADRYALYFWGHGWGWHPDWTMSDHTSGEDGLNPDEVTSVLPQLGFIDVVAYDACNMAQIEIAELWHGHATALAGSQEFVNWDGIEYDVVLRKLHRHPDMTADEVAIATSRSAIFEKTFSAIAVDARYEALRTAVDEWSTALQHALPEQRHAIRQGFAAARSFWEAPTDKDLYDLAKQVTARVTGKGLRATGRAVMEAVDAVVLHRRFSGDRFSMVHGLTITGISRPGQRNADWTYYHSLDFAQATGWDEFEDLLVQ